MTPLRTKASLATHLLWGIAATCWLAAQPTLAGGSLAERIQQIVSRPEFWHASFGIEFYSLDTGQVLYALEPDKLFTPASTTKLLTEGAALQLLGPGYRFRTRVYRTGPLTANGTLQGDLVLVASGDPNLSGRLQPDGTLAFQNEDHSYGGPPVRGDPLEVIRELARQVASHGIKHVQGSVVVDASLFPEGEPEGGTGMIESPAVVNDNIIDVLVRPGPSVNAPAQIQLSPATAYLRVVNQVTTGPPLSRPDAKWEPDLKWEKDVANPDGTHTATLVGRVPLGPVPDPLPAFPYPVPQPSRFAKIVFAETLEQTGITLGRARLAPDAKTLAAFYKPENLVAEHVSPPLSEEVKLTLKVSQNLHASNMPYLLGALAARQTANLAQAGFDLEHDWLTQAGLDLSGASQGDGAGGSEAAFFTPDFMVHYLAYIARQPYYPVFLQALPVLGRDGTLWNIQVHSPAAGHVFAKTGTYTAYDPLNRNLMVTGKGLAGYMTTPGGQHLAFAIYANHVAIPQGADAATQIVGQALGEIAAAGYLAADQEAVNRGRKGDSGAN